MQFSATERSVKGTSASRRLRRAGRVPAIVYGGKPQSIKIELDHNDIFHALRKEQFHSSILDMDINGKVEPVLLRSVQWHPYKKIVLHVDFQRVNAEQVVHIKIPLHFINEINSPAVKLRGAIVSHVLTEIEISCLPKHLPQFVQVDLSDLQVGSPIHLQDVTLPEGVSYVSHGGDPNPLLVSAVVKGADDAKDSDPAIAEAPPAA